MYFLLLLSSLFCISAVKFQWLYILISMCLCVLDLKGNGESVGPSQGEPKAADPAARYGTGTV